MGLGGNPCVVSLSSLARSKSPRRIYLGADGVEDSLRIQQGSREGLVVDRSAGSKGRL